MGYGKKKKAMGLRRGRLFLKIPSPPSFFVFVGLSSLFKNETFQVFDRMGNNNTYKGSESYSKDTETPSIDKNRSAMEGRLFQLPGF